MRFQKEIKALAEKIAKAEFDFTQHLYKREDAELLTEDGVTERIYVEGSVEHVDSLIYDEIVGNLSDAAITAYNRLVRAKYRYGRNK